MLICWFVLFLQGLGVYLHSGKVKMHLLLRKLECFFYFIPCQTLKCTPVSKQESHTRTWGTTPPAIKKHHILTAEAGSSIVKQAET